MLPVRGEVPHALTVPGAEAILSPCPVFVRLRDNTTLGCHRGEGMKFHISQTEIP